MTKWIRLDINDKDSPSDDDDGAGEKSASTSAAKKQPSKQINQQSAKDFNNFQSTQDDFHWKNSQFRQPPPPRIPFYQNTFQFQQRPLFPPRAFPPRPGFHPRPEFGLELL